MFTAIFISDSLLNTDILPKSSMTSASNLVSVLALEAHALSLMIHRH